MSVYPETEQAQCLDGHRGDCEGPVEPRHALSASGQSFPRCDGHRAERVRRQEQIHKRYPQHPPTDWSPRDAGEAWEED